MPYLTTYAYIYKNGRVPYAMIDKKEFSELRKELEGRDNTRESIIAQSREIITLSKQTIYAVHRKDTATAQKKLSDMKKQVALLQKIDIPLDTNMATVAYQEYVEAAAYVHFMEKGVLMQRKAMGVDSESYLLGLCDLTGELMRKAVDDIINKNYDHAYKIRELVTLIYGEFLQFNLRNGELRKKSDQIKWNLQKIEDLIYDVEMKKR
jgi:translin